MFTIRTDYKNSQTIVRDNGDGTLTFIPFDTDNVDYVAYQAWVAEGNTAQPYVEL